MNGVIERQTSCRFVFHVIGGTLMEHKKVEAERDERWGT